MLLSSGDVGAIKVPGGFFPSNVLAARTNATTGALEPARDDPKAARTTDRITYTLDPVDDLQPGTYVASIEITDRGRKSATPTTRPRRSAR